MRDLIIALLLILPVCHAAIYAKHACSDPVCFEGTDINFSVLIHNNLKDSIVIDNIFIRDVDTGQVLAVDARREQILLANEAASFTLPSLVKAPVEGYTFYYVPCFEASSFNETGILQEATVCGTRIESLTIVPSDEGCHQDGDCAADEYCNTFSLYRCRMLECSANQSIVDHACVDLSCGLLQRMTPGRCEYDTLMVTSALLVAFTLIVLLMLSLRKHK